MAAQQIDLNGEPFTWPGGKALLSLRGNGRRLRGFSLELRQHAPATDGWHHLPIAPFVSEGSVAADLSEGRYAAFITGTLDRDASLEIEPQ